MYPTVGGYTCCGCSITKAASKNFRSIFGLFFHALRHRLKGDYIPPRAIGRMIYEIITLRWF
jgi:hypothetical protein